MDTTIIQKVSQDHLVCLNFFQLVQQSLVCLGILPRAVLEQFMIFHWNVL